MNWKLWIELKLNLFYLEGNYLILENLSIRELLFEDKGKLYTTAKGNQQGIALFSYTLDSLSTVSILQIFKCLKM